MHAGEAILQGREGDRAGGLVQIGEPTKYTDITMKVEANILTAWEERYKYR